LALAGDCLSTPRFSQPGLRMMMPIVHGGPPPGERGGFLDDPAIARARGAPGPLGGQRGPPADACIQALCGKSKNIVRDVCCDSGNREHWSYVGEGQGCYDTVKRYEYVGDNRGAFEREEVLNKTSAWRVQGWLLCMLLFGVIGGAAYAAGRFYAKVSKADRFDCDGQDAATRSTWSSEQSNWCCNERGICQSTMSTGVSDATLGVGAPQAPGQAAVASDPTAAGEPTLAPMPATTPPLIAESTPQPPPLAPKAPAVPASLPPATTASPNGVAGAPQDKCNYDGVLFAANLVEWNPPVWKYDQESNTCSALRAGSSSWEKLAFSTQAACLSACASNGQGGP